MLIQHFNNDPSRQSAHAHEKGKSITISRHPIDVAGMATGRKWDAGSCMRIGDDGSTKENPGCNRHFLKADMRHGTLAAYVHDTDDTELKNPHSRVLLKRHDSGEHGDAPIFRPEGRIYGDQNKDIHHTLKKWSEIHYPESDEHVYAKHPALYNDDGKTIHESGKKERKFNPHVMDRHVDLAGMSYEARQDADKHGFGDYSSLHDHIDGSLYNYKSSLGADEKAHMDKHMNLNLAEDYHSPERSRDPHWGESPDHYENDRHARAHSTHHFAINNANIRPQHVDEIAKKFTDSHDEQFGDHTTAEHRWDDLESAVLNHGSDESKADVLKHHGTYGYDNPMDSEFDPRNHIVGKHTAKAFYDAHLEHGDSSPYAQTHTNMARHADDETFHKWLHGGHIEHNKDSYEAMMQGASKQRQHKIVDDLKFDNSEHNGSISDKADGIVAGTNVKGVMKKIVGDRGVDKETRRNAIYNLRHGYNDNSDRLEETKK